MNVKTKKMLSLVLAFVMVLGMLPATVFATNEAGRFVDVPAGAWFSDAVQYVADNGLMVGVDDNHFAPGGLTTRCMVVKVLHRMEGEPSAEGTGFTDVEDGVWYTEAILWAQANGIVEGYGDGTFHPHASMTREEMMAVIYRYSQYKGYDVSETTSLRVFTDSVKIQSYAEDAMAWAVSAGLIVGFEDGTIRPQADSNRAQLATVLMRFCQMFMAGVTYTISFDSNGGTAVDSQSVISGKTASIPAEPTKNGFMFVGWFENPNESDWSKVFSFDTPILKDMMLYAIWVDTSTDTDKDGLADDLEDYIGTNIANRDSDGDGLSDYEEQIVLNYDPTSVDTDGNGIEDGAEDHDGDGLDNMWEYENGTNPILCDSDNDVLNDFTEVNSHFTNPTNPDTDGDSVNDGDEVRIGTNPLVVEETFTEEASYAELSENVQVTVDVEADINGEQVGTLEISPATYGTNPLISPTIPGYLGMAYDISLDGQPTSAVLTFRYDTGLGVLGEDFQPRVYYFNEETKSFEELPNQEVTEGQVTVTVEHFSTYILLNKIEFDQVWEFEIKPPDMEVEQEDAILDIVFVIDYSLSMDENDPTQLFKDLSKEFVGKLRDGIDRAAVIKFIRVASLLSPLTTDKEALNAAIDSISYDNGYGSNSGTDGSAGIHLALQQLIPSESQYKYIVFITDGEDNGYSYSYDSLISSAVDAGVNIYTVGMGSASESVLKSVAEGTGGKYFHATTTADADDVLNLDEVFAEIESETIDYTTDTNQDGISDYYTQLIKDGKLPLSNGSREFMGIDFNYNRTGNLSNDYDGDGVKNGDELVVTKCGNRVYMTMVSDPMMEYSDADPYSDYREHMNNTDPLVYTYTADTVDYPWDDENFTYVDVYNTEDAWWNEGGRQVWSSITFNWSHQDEAKRLLASFFDVYSNLDSIEETTESITREMADLLGQDFLSQASDLVELGDLSQEAYGEIAEAVKKWRAAGNSAKNLSPDHFVQFKAQVGLFEYKYKFKGFSKLDKIGMGLDFAMDEIGDLTDWVETYASIIATQAAFEENKDILERIKANDKAKEKYVTRAAEDLLLLVNDEQGKFLGEEVKDFTLATTENIASLGLTMLSHMNPYILAVDLAVDLLDALTPATEITEAAYCLYVIDELTLATKDLFTYETKTADYYDILDSNTRHIELLICARIWGGEFAKTITGNQHYWGLFNDDRIRKEYADAIDSENYMLELFLSNFSK